MQLEIDPSWIELLRSIIQHLILGKKWSETQDSGKKFNKTDGGEFGAAEFRRDLLHYFEYTVSFGEKARQVFWESRKFLACLVVGPLVIFFSDIFLTKVFDSVAYLFSGCICLSFSISPFFFNDHLSLFPSLSAASFLTRLRSFLFGGQEEFLEKILPIRMDEDWIRLKVWKFRFITRTFNLVNFSNSNNWAFLFKSYFLILGFLFRSINFYHLLLVLMMFESRNWRIFFNERSKERVNLR